MSRLLFGGLLSFVGLLYFWLAYQTVAPALRSGDWVEFIGTGAFLAAGIGAMLAGVNLIRKKLR